MKKFITLLTIGLLAVAGVKADDNWVLSLSGAGNTTLGSNGGTTVGGNIEVGKQGKILLPVEAGVRFGAGYNTGNDAAIFNTSLYGDVFPIKFHRLELGGGLNIGSTWGNTPVVWSASPEAVLRLWVKEDVGIFARAEYPLDLGNQKLGDRINYFLGVVFRF